MASTEVINMRVERERKERLRRAAELSSVPLSTFVLDAATARADEVLAEQRATGLPEQFFDAFFAAVNTPVPEPLIRLAEQPRPYRRR